MYNFPASPYFARTLALIILSFFFSLGVRCADTIYVATNGNNANSGSFDDPLASLQDAVNRSGPGDLIYVRGGTYVINPGVWYNEKIGVLIRKDGTTGAKSRIFNYPGETPIFDFRNLYDKYISGIELRADHWHIRGLTLINVPLKERSNSTGIKLADASYNTIESCVTTAISGTGIRIEGNSTMNVLLNCDSYANYDALTRGGNADGFQVAFVPKNTYNFILGCRAWDNSDDGFDLYENEGYVYITDCWAWHNGYIPGTNESAGDGTGFKLGRTNEPRSGDFQRIVLNSLAFNNKQNGFYDNSGDVSMFIGNCTAFNNVERGFRFSNTGCSFFNNISFQNGYSVMIGGNSDEEKNTWQGINLDAEDFISFNAQEVSAPRAIDGTLPNVSFLMPDSLSALIDAGFVFDRSFLEDVPTHPQNYERTIYGEGPDIGAFEYSECYNFTISAEISHQHRDLSDGMIDITVSDPFPPHTFNWSTGSQEEDLIGITAGEYTLEITNSQGCKLTRNFYIEELPPLFGSGTGLEDSLNTKYFFRVYPNPTRSFVFIISKSDFDLEIFDTSGRRQGIYPDLLSGVNGISFSQPPGNYLLSFRPKGSSYRVVRSLVISK